MLALGLRCFCESSVSNLAKDYDYVLDLGKFTGTKAKLDDVIEECAASRAAPLSPADFRRMLSTKSFTSKKADEEMVARLYETTFDTRMGAATKLIYNNLQWGDAEVATLCTVIATGRLAQLKVRAHTPPSPVELVSLRPVWHVSSPRPCVL